MRLSCCGALIKVSLSVRVQIDRRERNEPQLELKSILASCAIQCDSGIAILLGYHFGNELRRGRFHLRGSCHVLWVYLKGQECFRGPNLLHLHRSGRGLGIHGHACEKGAEETH